MNLQPLLIFILLPVLQACTAITPATHAQPGYKELPPAAKDTVVLKACLAEAMQDTVIPVIQAQKIMTFVQVNY